MTTGFMLMGASLIGYGLIPAAKPPQPQSSSLAAPPPPAQVMQAMPPSQPVRLVIPSIAVNAPLMELGLNTDQTVQTPPLTNTNVAGWYKYGSFPGAKGPAVLLGHVDGNGHREVFWNLGKMQKGAEIDVYRHDGTEAVFQADTVTSVPKAKFPTSSVYGPVNFAAIRVVTCGGDFDAATGHYLNNIIVYGHLVSSKHASA